MAAIIQPEVVRILTEVSKKHNVSYNTVKEVYYSVFQKMLLEFKLIDDQNPDTWNKNTIIKNFGKFAINKNRLKKYGSYRKIKEDAV